MLLINHGTGRPCGDECASWCASGMMISVESTGASRPRAVGRRIKFARVPESVRAWVTNEFGPVRVVAEHVGGMSPGCAATLVSARSGNLFVKAVGPELNPQTPTLFRQEIQVLTHLPKVSYRPALLAGFDDGKWVGLVLEHIPGRYPDLGATDDFAAVAATVHAQTAEFTPAPTGVVVPSLAHTAQRWATRWGEMSHVPHRFLPSWAAERVDELLARVTILPTQLPEAALCHFDVRDDNLLIRPDGRAVIFDWGMARRGPSWIDQVFLAAQTPTAREAQSWLERWVPAESQDTVTSLLVAFAGSQAWNAQQPPKPSLPSLTTFTRDDARRLFDIARLRLR